MSTHGNIVVSEAALVEIVFFGPGAVVMDLEWGQTEYGTK